MNGCECFDPNDTSPLCANSPILPPTPAPTAEDTQIGINDDTPIAAPTDVYTSLEESFDDDPPPEVDDGGQDTITILIGASQGSLNGVERDPAMSVSSTVNSVSFKRLYSLIQSSLLVIMSLT